MGFRTGAYAKVWDVKSVSDALTSIRISINKKNKEDGKYEQDFNGYVSCIGTAVAKKALGLVANDSMIVIGDCDVATKFDKEKRKTYVNYKIYSFDIYNGGGNHSSNTKPKEQDVPIIEGDTDEDEFPF